MDKQMVAFGRRPSGRILCSRVKEWCAGAAPAQMDTQNMGRQTHQTQEVPYHSLYVNYPEEVSPLRFLEGGLPDLAEAKAPGSPRAILVRREPQKDRRPTTRAVGTDLRRKDSIRWGPVKVLKPHLSGPGDCPSPSPKGSVM